MFMQPRPRSDEYQYGEAGDGLPSDLSPSARNFLLKVLAGQDVSGEPGSADPYSPAQLVAMRDQMASELSAQYGNGQPSNVPRETVPAPALPPTLRMPQAGMNQYGPRGTGVVQRDGEAPIYITPTAPQAPADAGWDADVSRPMIEAFGKKGYYSKDGKWLLQDNPDGTQSRTALNFDADKYRANQDRAMKMAQADANLAKTQAETRNLDLKPVGPVERLGPGEERGADGVVRLRPTSAQYAKQNDSHSKDWKAVQSAKEKTEQIMSGIDGILDPKGTGDPKEYGKSEGFQSLFGGFNAYASRLIPTDETQNAVNRLDTLQKKITGEALDVIRESGSVGPMAVQEWGIIRGMIENLTPRMGEDEAVKQLTEIKSRMATFRQRAQKAYEMEWGDSQFAKKGKDAADSLEETKNPGALRMPQSKDEAKEQRYQEWKRKQGL